MVDVFDEVEEELRQERYKSLLKKWGPIVGAVALAIVLGVAGNEAWKAWSEGQAEEASERFYAARDALEGGDREGAEAGFAAMSEDGPRGYATLALMQRAAMAEEDGDFERAMQLYDEAVQRSPAALIRDLARYRSALAGFDVLSADDIRLRLEPLLTADPAQALLARELIGAAALRDERWDEARRQYQFIQSALDAPQGLRRRAAEALALINVRAPLPAADALPAVMGEDAADPSGLLPEAAPVESDPLGGEMPAEAAAGVQTAPEPDAAPPADPAIEEEDGA
ncbi:tetratricopeptide repeat protein [Glycocaulis profundi]|nr:tetratricopeptide repeat protein [Glycocaulis profundi]